MCMPAGRQASSCGTVTELCCTVPCKWPSAHPNRSHSRGPCYAAQSGVLTMVYHRRSNYVLVTAASTSVMLLRNPLGTISLGLLALGGMLFNDAVAQQASRRVVAFLRKADPQRAVKICGVPGGHDGSRCCILRCLRALPTQTSFRGF